MRSRLQRIPGFGTENSTGMPTRYLAPVGKIQSVGIKETFRRQGLAVWLMKYALRQFAEKGIGEVFIICWNAGGKVPLEGHFRNVSLFIFFLQR